MLQPIVRTFVLADLKCYMCGATAGSLERERGSTTPQVAIERAGRVGSIVAGETSRLRCPRPWVARGVGGGFGGPGGRWWPDARSRSNGRTTDPAAVDHPSGWSSSG